MKGKLFSKSTDEEAVVHQAENQFAQKAQTKANGFNGKSDSVADNGVASVEESGSTFDFGDLKGKFEVCDPERLMEHHIFVRGLNKEAKIAISAYKSLRTRVVLKMEEIKVNTVMVLGAAQNVGKTLTSINLAIALARQEEKRVILVDLDLRSPSLHHLFGFEPKGNILDVADGKKKLSDVLVDPGIPGLKILPGTVRHEDSAEALIRPNTVRLLNEMKQLNNTIIVYDTPPVLGCDDVALVAPHMDSSLFVVREGETSRKELRQSLAMLDSQIPVLGVAINRSSEGNFSSYYY
ncbi:MAG: CpsD/CapB family tyrosine-protein kinase [Pseudomonadota bacterium]